MTSERRASPRQQEGGRHAGESGTRGCGGASGSQATVCRSKQETQRRDQHTSVLEDKTHEAGGHVDADVVLSELVVQSGETESTVPDVSMDPDTAALVSASMLLRVCSDFEALEEELEEADLMEIAPVVAVLNEVDVSEIYSPARFCVEAARVGLRSGLSADLEEVGDSRPWDLSRPHPFWRRVPHGRETFLGSGTLQSGFDLRFGGRILWPRTLPELQPNFRSSLTLLIDPVQNRLLPLDVDDLYRLAWPFPRGPRMVPGSHSILCEP